LAVVGSITSNQFIISYLQIFSSTYKEKKSS